MLPAPFPVEAAVRLGLMDGGRPEGEGRGRSAGVSETPPNGGPPSAVPWIVRALQGVPEGERNNTATRLAGYFRRLGMEADAALALLGLWNLHNAPPLPERELESVVKSVWRYPGPPDPAPCLSVADLMAKQFPPTRWIVPDLLPEGSLAIVASRAKLGKTWLMMQLMIAVASGGRFLGRPVERGAVVYVALEDGDRLFQERLRLMDAPPDLTDAFYAPDIPPLNAPEGIEAVRRLIAAKTPKLLIVDTLSAAKTGKLDENLAGDFADLANPLRDLAHETNCTILLVHHHGKMASGDAVMDLRGSTALGAAVDVIWGLYRERGQGRAILTVAGRNVRDQSLALDFDDAGTKCWQLVGDAHEVALTEAEEEILAVLEGGEADANAIAGELGKARQVVHRVLERMAKNGKVCARYEGGPKGRPRKVYFLPPRASGVIGGVGGALVQNWGQNDDGGIFAP